MFHSMRGKVLAAIVGVTMFVGILITILFYGKSAEMIEKNYSENLYARIQQLGDTFDGALKDIYNLTIRTACDEGLLAQVQAYLLLDETAQTETLAAALKTAAKSSADITSMYLVFPEKRTIVTSKEYPICEKNVDLSEIKRIEHMARNSITPAVMCDPVGKNSDILSFVSTVENAQGIVIAYLMSNIEERALYYRYVDIIADEKTESAFILDQNSVVVSTKNQQDVGKPYQARIQEKHGKVIRTVYCTEFTGCCFLIETERGKVLADLQKFRFFLTIILFAVFLTALVPTVWMTKALNRPLKNLTQTMKQVSEGELSRRVEIVTKDEIGTLSHDFNRMLDHIENLIEQLIKEERLKKDAELDALQYQITPHFMYNTLNSIKYAALLKGEQEIGDLIENFVELLQASINKKGIFVTVAEELNFIENYMTLQNMRYEEKIVISYEVQSEAQGCFLPRLMLQPLVENAILHGMDIKSGNSRILIRGRIEAEILYLTVEDNGKGMSEEQIALLLAVKDKKTSGLSGIGIANVRERLELYYGEQGGLRYESSEAGTKACIYLPAYKEQNRYAL